jgi:hypothetical protein
LALLDRKTGFQPVREDSASSLSANETTGWKSVGPDRRDACPPANLTVSGILPGAIVCQTMRKTVQSGRFRTPPLAEWTRDLAENRQILSQSPEKITQLASECRNRLASVGRIGQVPPNTIL